MGLLGLLIIVACRPINFLIPDGLYSKGDNSGECTEINRISISRPEGQVKSSPETGQSIKINIKIPRMDRDWQ